MEIVTSSRSEGEALRGQILALFALMLVVLIGMTGLAIDVAHARSTAERAQRAAEAGALAGVALLPDPVTGDGYNASVQAVTLTGLNDFSCVTAPTTIVTTTLSIGNYRYDYTYKCNTTTSILVTAYPKRDRLEETITTDVAAPFLGVLKRGKFTVVRSAAAVYQNPVELGAPDNELGFAPYETHAFDQCPPGSPTNCGTNVQPATPLPQDFYLQLKGPYEGTEHGDALSPYFESANGGTFLTCPSSVPSPQCRTDSAVFSNVKIPDPCGTDPCIITNTSGITSTVAPNPYYNYENTASVKVNQTSVLNGYSYLFTIPPNSPKVLLKVMDPLDECYYDSSQGGGQSLTQAGTTYEYDPDTLSSSDVPVKGPDGSTVSSTFLDQCTTGKDYLANTASATAIGQATGGAEKYFPTTLSFELSDPVFTLGSDFSPASPGTTNNASYFMQLASGSTPLTPTGTTLVTDTYGVQPLYLGPDFKTSVNGTSYCHNSLIDSQAACIGGHGFSWFTLAIAQNKSTTQTAYVELVINSVVNGGVKSPVTHKYNSQLYQGTYGAGGNVFSLGLCGWDSSGAAGDPGNPVDDANWIRAALTSADVGQPFVNTTPAWTPWTTHGNYAGDGCASPGSAGYTVTAREAMCIITEQTGTNSYIPLGEIPESYEGSTVQLQLFDPGDAGGTNMLGVMSPQDRGTVRLDRSANGWGSGDSPTPLSEPYTLDIAAATNSGYSNMGQQRPTGWWACGDGDYNADDHQNFDGTAFPAPGCGLGTTTTSLVTVANNGTHDFANGTWLDFNMVVPSNYETQTGQWGNNWWKMYYQLSVGGTATDTTTWRIPSDSSPIHLTKLTS